MKIDINNPVIVCKEISFENYEKLLRRAMNILLRKQIRKMIKAKENKKFILFADSNDIYKISKKQAKKCKLLN